MLYQIYKQNNKIVLLFYFENHTEFTISVAARPELKRKTTEIWTEKEKIKKFKLIQQMS